MSEEPLRCRGRIGKGLNTAPLDVARLRRDALERADLLSVSG